MGDHHVTVATRGDLPAVSELVNSAYRGDSSRAGWTTEADYIDGQRTSVADLESDLAETGEPEILILRQAGSDDLLACVLIETLATERGVAGYIGMLTVRPGLQNGGVGRLMLQAAEDQLRRRGLLEVRMTVVSIREPLIAWYLRRGYQLTDKILPFPYDDERFGLPRVEGLTFVLLVKPLEPLSDNHTGA